MQIRWKEIPGYDGRYRVSDTGQIASNALGKWAIIRQSADGVGYRKVTLKLRRKATTRRVHRFVAEAFLPNPEKHPTVNHKNGDKADNRVDNLEWATQKTNNDHALAKGLNVKARGERIGTAKLTASKVLEIRRKLAEGQPQRALAAEYGVYHATIGWIATRRSWKHI